MWFNTITKKVTLGSNKNHLWNWITTNDIIPNSSGSPQHSDTYLNSSNSSGSPQHSWYLLKQLFQPSLLLCAAHLFSFSSVVWTLAIISGQFLCNFGLCCQWFYTIDTIRFIQHSVFGFRKGRAVTFRRLVLLGHFCNQAVVERVLSETIL